MNSNTIRRTSGPSPGSKVRGKEAFGNRQAPLIEQIDFQRALHDDFDLRSQPIHGGQSSILLAGDHNFEQNLF